MKEIVELTIIPFKNRTRANAGSRDNQYLYAYDPEVVHVTKKDTKIVYQLSDQTDARFVITELFLNDPTEQIQKAPKISKNKRRVSFVVTNRAPRKRKFISPLLDLLIQVHEILADVPVSCDPQVTCSPARPPSQPKPKSKKRNK